jgi:hypothetical protein
MPKLSYPKITKGDAITALLKIYRKEPDFMTELEKIRQPYLAILSKFAKDAFAFFNDGAMSPAEYYQAVIDYNKGESQKDPFPAKQFGYLSQLQPYFDGLSGLAYKWKLRAPWAVIVLFLFDLMDLLKAQGLPDEIDIPLESLESIYPWAPPVPPLEIKIPAWAIILFGRQVVQAEVKEKLQEYEDKIKGKGLHEYPSGLKKVAYWWFQYNIKGKRWVDLANEEAQDDPEGGPHPENIRKAVSRFSKLIGIQTSVKKE